MNKVEPTEKRKKILLWNWRLRCIRVVNGTYTDSEPSESFGLLDSP